jgi:HPt (histidine-containing phosphotransfer) domain-containing protein
MNDIFNKAELLEELDGDREFLEESVEMLVKDAPNLLAEIKNGLAENDTEAIWKNAHTLKSMVGNFSAKRSFEAAYQVESLGRKGNASEMNNAITHLESEVGLLVSALIELLENK